MIGLLGKKLGMTHVYNDSGEMVCVTAIEAGRALLYETSRIVDLEIGYTKRIEANPPEDKDELKQLKEKYNLAGELKVEDFINLPDIIKMDHFMIFLPDNQFSPNLFPKSYFICYIYTK
jgi:ribosomal protein L3